MSLAIAPTDHTQARLDEIERTGLTAHEAYKPFEFKVGDTVKSYNIFFYNDGGTSVLGVLEDGCLTQHEDAARIKAYLNTFFKQPELSEDHQQVKQELQGWFVNSEGQDSDYDDEVEACPNGPLASCMFLSLADMKPKVRPTELTEHWLKNIKENGPDSFDVVPPLQFIVENEVRDYHLFFYNNELFDVREANNPLWGRMDSKEVKTFVMEYMNKPSH